MDLKKLHEEVLYTAVRVKTAKAGGSGTIIYSEKEEGTDKYSTYVLTCHHVIDSAISYKDDWDVQLQRNRKREMKQIVTVEFFDYGNVIHGNRPVTFSTDADIITYDKDHDMAILKLQTVKKAEHVAHLLPSKWWESLIIGSPIVAVGAALLHDPVLTTGIVTHMGDEIDYKKYWMGNASIIFGNSGGAVFTDIDGKYVFLGIPSRVDIQGWGVAVTHLGYFSPISRVYEFFDEQKYHFLIPGHEHTEAMCEKERKDILEREKRRATLDNTPNSGSGNSGIPQQLDPYDENISY